MSTDNYGVFVSLSSFIIVVGGALAASFVSYELRYVMLALKMTYKIHGAPTIGRNLIKGEVGRIIRWAYVVQKSGIPALESEVKKGKVDSFLAFGADLVISGYSGDDVREILSNTIKPTPGVEWRTRAMVSSTLCPGNWPPSPGFAPCAILICTSSLFTR